MAVKAKGIALAVALTVLGLGSSSRAQVTIVFNAVGASAAFNSFALAGIWGSGSAPPGPCGSNIWTQKNGATAHDNRNPYTNPPNQIPDTTGNVWVEWDNSSSPTLVCAYVGVDSAVTQRLFFANPRGQLNLPSGFTCASPPAGNNLVPGLTDAALSTTVCNEIFGANGATSSCLTGTNCVFNAAPTDIRPEDTLWATERTYNALPTPYACGPGQSLGYSPGPAPNVGVNINSAFSSKYTTPVLWALSGNDPISGLPVQPWQTADVGAQVLLVIVNTSDTTAEGLGSTQLKNLQDWQIGYVFSGQATTTEFLVPGASETDVTPLHVIEREALSGTYNVFDYNEVGSGRAGNFSEECGVTNPTGGSPYNPLDLTYSTGGTRQRAIGTSEEISELQTIEDSIGYAFFSFGNVATLVGNAKYLEVDEVEPLYSSYTSNPNGAGQFPTCSTPPCKLSFPNVGNGEYPLWNVLRVTTASPEPASVATLLSDAELQAKNEISDFLPVPLAVLRSHYTDPGQSNTPANGLLCTGEIQVGGDNGGQILTTTADDNFIRNTGGFGVSNGSGGCNAGRGGTLGREPIDIRNWNP
jgi:ABC-type phosphate transport system substrate-binding protein